MIITGLVAATAATAIQAIANNIAGNAQNPNKVREVGVYREVQLYSTEDQFIVSYKDDSGQVKEFYFHLLPSIESHLKLPGNTTATPEVKPGILIRTGMNYKRFLVPGSTPVFQSLGVEETMIQLVGAFTGLERVDEPVRVLNNIQNLPLNSYRTAMTFDREVVQSGREVQVVVASGTGATQILVSYYGVISNMRYFAVRSDRTYYALDLRVTRYPGSAAPSKTELQAPQLGPLPQGLLPQFSGNADNVPPTQPNNSPGAVRVPVPPPANTNPQP